MTKIITIIYNNIYDKPTIMNNKIHANILFLSLIHKALHLIWKHGIEWRYPGIKLFSKMLEHLPVRYCHSDDAMNRIKYIFKGETVYVIHVYINLIVRFTKHEKWTMLVL